MTPTFQNLGFEIAGSASGLAAGWTLAWQASAEEVAGYGLPEQPVEEPVEAFERGWLGNDAFIFTLAQTAVEPALYDDKPESVEDFEAGWSQNDTFLFELGSIDAADYDGTGTKFVEDFEAHFAGNEAFLLAFAPGSLASGPLESFESGWRSNQTFLFAFGSGDLSAAPTETFESSWTHMTTM